MLKNDRVLSPGVLQDYKCQWSVTITEYKDISLFTLLECGSHVQSCASAAAEYRIPQDACLGWQNGVGSAFELHSLWIRLNKHCSPNFFHY